MLAHSRPLLNFAGATKRTERYKWCEQAWTGYVLRAGLMAAPVLPPSPAHKEVLQAASLPADETRQQLVFVPCDR